MSKLTEWKAMPWVTGGSAAIMLKDPNDTATISQVRELLAKLPAIRERRRPHSRGG